MRPLPSPLTRYPAEIAKYMDGETKGEPKAATQARKGRTVRAGAGVISPASADEWPSPAAPWWELNEHREGEARYRRPLGIFELACSTIKV